jgi:hypothetical protein
LSDYICQGMGGLADYLITLCLGGWKAMPSKRSWASQEQCGQGDEEELAGKKKKKKKKNKKTKKKNTILSHCAGPRRSNLDEYMLGGYGSADWGNPSSSAPQP